MHSFYTVLHSFIVHEIIESKVARLIMVWRMSMQVCVSGRHFAELGEQEARAVWIN